MYMNLVKIIFRNYDVVKNETEISKTKVRIIYSTHVY